jgi:outer membrane protein assembly factor BamE
LRGFVLFPLAVAVLSGCGLPRLLSPYTIEIQQGNYVTQEQVAQLHRGMTRDQVRYLLGTPLLNDPFHADRWDYVFRRLRANSRELEERRLTLFFANDKLDRVTGDVAVALGTTESGEPELPPPPSSAETPAAGGGLPQLPPPEPLGRGPVMSPEPGRGPAPDNLPPAAQPPMGQR